MSQFTLHYTIDMIVRDKAGRMALEDRECGRSDVPASLYIERIADRVGVAKRTIYRFMDGSQSPSANMLRQLCTVCESPIPLEYQIKEYRALVRQGAMEPASRRDIVSLTSAEMEDVAKTVRATLDAVRDGRVTKNEADAVARSVAELLDATMDLQTAVQSMAEPADPARPKHVQPVARLRNA
jgi:transcriptional regulator with XRE-family HTH domain